MSLTMPAASTLYRYKFTSPKSLSPPATQGLGCLSPPSRP
jgi:hypothetical protein